MSYQKIIDDLFKEAKKTDEFEYVCAMLDFQGVQAPGWDPLQETIYVFQDLTGLLSGPLREDTRARLALLLYCHITEAETIYRIIYNMLRITEGFRSSSFPFEPLVIKRRNGDRIEPSVRKIVTEVTSYATQREHQKIAEILENAVNHELRNAFYHSDYTLYDGEFRSKGSWFMHENNVRSQVLSNEELTEIVNSGITFFQDFMAVYMLHRRSYKKNKVVRGRFIHDDSYINVTLIAMPPHGVYGFEGKSFDGPST